MAVTTFAAIDIGSHEVEMVIYEISPRQIKALDQVRHSLALGKDTYNYQRINYVLVDELCDVLADFCTIMKTYDVKNYRACATSAIREAKNARSIIDRIQVSTGLKVEILSNSEQRLITYKAVASQKEGFDSLIEKGTAMADVGSGSSQVSLFDNGSLITTQNVQLGAMRVNEVIDNISFGNTDSRALMEEYIDTDIEVLKHLFIKDKKVECIIAVGDSINWIFRKLKFIVQKDFYTREDFQNIYTNVYFMKDAKELGLSDEQFMMLVPSIMIYKKILDVFEAQTLWIPGISLCDGLVSEFASGIKKTANSDEHDFNNDIIAAAKNISKRYSWNKEHIKFVEKNAMDIFDATKKIHGLGKRERLLLQIACILHDCGQYISMIHPSECSYSIIMATEIIGLSHLERAMVANIVKYTTIDFNEDNGLATGFSNESFLTISKLSAIIKIANSLDRGHRQKFKNTKYHVNGREFEIITKTYEDISLEKGLICKKTTLFEQVYGLKPVIVQKRA